MPDIILTQNGKVQIYNDKIPRWKNPIFVANVAIDFFYFNIKYTIYPPQRPALVIYDPINSDYYVHYRPGSNLIDPPNTLEKFVNNTLVWSVGITSNLSNYIRIDANRLYLGTINNTFVLNKNTGATLFTVGAVRAIDIDSNGNIYTINGTDLRKFNSNGVLLFTVNVTITSFGVFHAPNGNIYVGHNLSGGNTFSIYDNNGNLITRLYGVAFVGRGTRSNADMTRIIYYGQRASSDSTYFRVTDQNNNTIFTLGGPLLSSTVFAVELDDDDNIYLTSTNANLRKYTKNGVLLLTASVNSVNFSLPDTRKIF
jgi:hypothetical protein